MIVQSRVAIWQPLKRILLFPHHIYLACFHTSKLNTSDFQWFIKVCGSLFEKAHSSIISLIKTTKMQADL